MAKMKLKELKAWLKFKDEWLDNQELRCLYCSRWLIRDEQIGKDVFKRTRIPGGRLATVDHVIPVSITKNRFDTDNMVVCCETCNGKKDNHMPNDWVTRSHTSLANRFNKFKDETEEQVQEIAEAIREKYEIFHVS